MTFKEQIKKEIEECIKIRNDFYKSDKPLLHPHGLVNIFKEGQLKAKLEGYKLAKKEIIEKIDIWWDKITIERIRTNLHEKDKKQYCFILDSEDIKNLKGAVFSPNKKGCGNRFTKDNLPEPQEVVYPYQVCGKFGYLCSECSDKTSVGK